MIAPTSNRRWKRVSKHARAAGLRVGLVIAIVALFLTNRERTRNANFAKPPSPPAPHAKIHTTSPSPQTIPTPTTTTITLTSPAAPVAVAPPAPIPPPPAPPPNEDGVALLPSVKPPAPPAVEGATDTATFVAFAPGGRLLVARASGGLQFVDLATGQRQAIEMKLPSPRAIALSPAGDRVAVANAESADVWHVASSSKTHLAGGDVTAIRFGRGGQLFTGHASGEVKVWATPNWTSSTTLRPNVGGAIAHIAESPSSAHVAVIGASGGIAVCDVGEPTVKQRLGADQAWTSVAFAPDGRTIAAAGARGVTRWDTILWQQRPAPGGSEPATHIAFWRGGTVLVTAGADGAIRIYDLATRQLMTTLNGKGPIVSIDLGDDGRTIATTTASGVSIWDATTRAARETDARP